MTKDELQIMDELLGKRNNDDLPIDQQIGYLEWEIESDKRKIAELRDSCEHEYTDDNDYMTCMTCGAPNLLEPEDYDEIRVDQEMGK